MTARDTAGLAAQQRFEVTVPQPNRPPRAVGTISNRSAAVDTEISIDVSPNFTDPDDDHLTYSAASSNTDVATVSTSNSTVTVTAEATGSATITVTARDPGGLTATQRFRITVRATNRAPRAVGTIRDRVATVGGAVSVDVPPYFTDPDGDDLEYSATSSNTNVATVGTSDGTVTIVGVAVGTATITVTARDPSGRTAAQRFTVTVRTANAAPEPVGTIPDETVVEGAEITIDLERFFTDRDGDDLVYSATSARDEIATVDISGSTLRLKGHQEGRTTITVTASDPGDLTATQRFEVTVEAPTNRAPVVVRRIRDVAGARQGEVYELLLTLVFADPDDDPLTFTAVSTNTAVAEPEIKGDTIFVAALAVGSATITVTATDPEGLSATEEFEMTVVEEFDIWLGWTDNVTETQKAWIRLVDRAWEKVLRDTELADYNMPDEVKCLDITTTAQDVPSVDDHLVLIDVRANDGPGGTLAGARYCQTRDTDGTPVVSAVVFDEADIGRVMALGGLGIVAFHEFAHGLGFISLYWDAKGLLDDGADDPHFTGALATSAFDAAGGTSYTGAKVPISSPDHSHWREDIFGLEGMTPLLTLGTTNPFSAITFQAMADVGYVVDLSGADGYQLPNTVPPDAVGQVLDLGNDVVRGPVMVLDSAGNIVRVIPAPPGAVIRSGPSRPVVEIERLGVPDGLTGEAGRTAPAGEAIWRRVTRPAPRNPQR